MSIHTPIDTTNAQPIDAPLIPNRADISSHLYALFAPAFVQPYPDAWIEIAFGRPGGALDAAKIFSVFDIEKAVDFAEKKNKDNFNVYVGVALRQGKKPRSGRASGQHVAAGAYAWVDYDAAGDDERINAILKEHKLTPALVVTTGAVPHPRRHLYFKLDGTVTLEKLEAANESLKNLLGSDDVQNPDRVLRLAGTISYPSADKKGRGYVVELTSLHLNKDARPFKVDELIGLAPASGEIDPYVEAGKESGAGPGRSDADILALLKASQVKNWHNNMRSAVSSMVCRRKPDSFIKATCAPYCEGEARDADLKVLIDTARKKYNIPNVEPPLEGTPAAENDVIRLNKTHAILPIGGKTRVVTFGELPAFPGRETIVMTQSSGDFQALQNKYRHEFQNEKGELKKVPLGTYWIQSPSRRQYDGGMRFMPHVDGDVGDKLNLWHGFGVKAVKPAPGSKADIGCKMFLDFMLVIICSGDMAHFDYLLKREATILQKRIRSEVALALRTKEEGCGKGFYEFVMRRLLGNHAMQITNPDHIVGKFNPHLETLLRLTADEALFVGNHKHRNALFSLITEADMAIEPKNCGIYQADNYLNLSITSNSDHFVPASGTARRFFIPTVSIARMQDHAYFDELKTTLEAGGYEALLHYLLYEVDLTGFNVRKVPLTAGLREQRDQSLDAFDSWWVELLETGVLTGSSPLHPDRAVSNAYQRSISVQVMEPRYDGATDADGHPEMRQVTRVRHVNQLGLYDQAKMTEPKLKSVSDHKLGAYLSAMGCDNKRKVMDRRGWIFPPLAECRAAWEKQYPGWKWRNPDIRQWQPEEEPAATNFPNIKRSDAGDLRFPPHASTSATLFPE
jgi:hypothetical protein